MPETALPPDAQPNTMTRPSQATADQAPDVSQFVGLLVNSLASLRLTVVLFALSMVLVFAGTLAQIDYGIWTIVNKYFRTLYVWIPLYIFFPRNWAVPGWILFPGGWLLGGLLLANLLAAHAVRFRASLRRAGILLLHSGLVVMMLSEFVTGMFAIEGNMSIDEGGASNYLEHNHVCELAVIDTSNPEMDDVVVVPQSYLRRGGLIQHELLPFDLEVVRFMVNSSLVRAHQVPHDAPNPATAGAGLVEVAVEQSEVSGTDQEQAVDTPSLYVTFKEKRTGHSLGTYLASIWLSPQPLAFQDKTYHIALRFKRSYKPYTVHLLDFRHDKYIGTDKPKNFSSDVRLVDPSRDETREVRISMNSPLRYAGETFYQSAFKPGDTGTILQVVRNPGWLMPYISCGMVSIGMLVHFGMNLYDFLRRRAAR